LANDLVFWIFQVFCNFIENYRKFLSPNALSAYGIQRGGGLAKRRLTLNVLRAASVRVRTALSAGLLPPLRQLSEAISPKVNRAL
jgi:hypothetical protein